MLSYEDGVAALDWLSKAFGFRERMRMLGEGGRLAHGEVDTGRPRRPSLDVHATRKRMTLVWRKMAKTKRSSTKKESSQEAGPKASRPHMPHGYGVPKDSKSLLPWSHVSERMDKAMHYWVCSISPGGGPHVMPVDGLWIDDKLYFGGSPETRRNRNIVANPAVCIHLENAMEVVILQGDAHELRAPNKELAIRLGEASRKKYGFGPKPEDFAAGGTFEFTPRVAFAWKQFPKDVTRWEFKKDR